MKKLLLIIFIAAFSAKGQGLKDSAFLVSASVNKASHSITLNWKIQGATRFQINRKDLNDINWGSNLANLNGNINTYTDTSAKVGKAYEYRIIKIVGNKAANVGYVASSIELPLVDFRNNLLLVFDSTTYNAIPSGEITQLKNDYLSDGFGVTIILVSASAKPPQIKSKIEAWYTANKTYNSYCLLIGKIAVPYAGLQVPNTADFNPDAHTDHGGAWPTDLYYAEFEGPWTDDGTMVSGVGRVANQNNPNDGKFDQHTLPDDVDLKIGRIDMSNLPSQPLSEVALIRQYFKKLHQFKAGLISVRNKAFVYDGFGALGTEIPMRSGWNNVSALVGDANINNSGNYFDSTKAKSYIFSDVMGGGNYTSASGVGSSFQFKDSILSVFNVQFGSYFGDWDNSDNFLKSCLASKGFTLTTCWAARPHWYFHHMALGLPIGYSSMVSQNNNTDLSFSSGYIGSYFHPYLDRRITMELLGDPTLRMHYLDMPKNVTTTNINSNTDVKLDWQASNEPNILGYHVYRKYADMYFRITSTPIVGLTYTDTDPYSGNNAYLVKAVKLETSNCGTYYNTSLGAMATATGVSGTNTNLSILETETFRLYPNPTTNEVNIEMNSFTNIEIMDINGKIIYTEKTSPFNKITISTNNWAKGMYIVMVNNNSGKAIKKLIVQ